ncbi:hypothetical protein BOTBODRAFT_59943 [Botryobasidium botryosum FD-172 SS1]|uniref:Amino acid permease/ SLC12A domain-containing protein n=1 Tax=Botryobasidium botryosum (strain FD-172 SS1) TaxID=930990 RepID=A0A067M7I5_BOTB1|nr:hypothetical protein BOTBODRAFT_59943 [Botryobasidium botryosum FD-172 SS1]
MAPFKLRRWTTPTTRPPLTTAQMSAMQPEPSSELDASTGEDSFGYKHEMGQRFSVLSLIGLAFAIANSWLGMALTLGVSLPSGGPSVVLWGDIVAGVGSMALASSLAEICSVYPTAAGQYYWTAALASPQHYRILSWVCGWFNVAGWVFIVAAISFFDANLVTSIIVFFHNDYIPQRWHTYLIFIAFTLGSLLINIFGVRLLPRLNRLGFYCSIGGLVVVCIVLLATASPNFQPGHFVFGGFINNTGWSDGVAWMLGLLQATFALTGYDACAHMVEEIPDPGRHAPRAMVLTVFVGVVTSFIFLVIFLFSAADFDAALASPAGPLLEIFHQATGNKGGAFCLIIIPLICAAFGTQAVLTASSRIVYAFARDGGLPFSGTLSKVDKKLQVPIPALLFCVGWTLAFGAISLGSTTAFNAVLSSSVIALNVSYAMPIAVLLYHGRSRLPRGSYYQGPILGYVSNIFALIFVAVTSVFFFFPPALPVNPTTMNYTSVVFAIVGLISGVTWFTQGRKHYRGPLKVHDKEFETVRTEAPPNESLLQERTPGEKIEIERSGVFTMVTAASERG